MEHKSNSKNWGSMRDNASYKSGVLSRHFLIKIQLYYISGIVGAIGLTRDLLYLRDSVESLYLRVKQVL